MRLLPSNLITIPDRQRKSRPRDFIQKLKDSIVSKGLLHPIVVTSALDLVAGEGRLIAMRELHIDGIRFNHNGAPVAPSCIPVSTLGELTPDDVAEAELEENILRVPLTWQEEVEAKVLIHQLRKRSNPAQTLTQTAAEISATRETTVENERHSLSKAIMVSQHMANPRVKAAKTLNEAAKIALDDLENSLRTQLLERGVTTSQHRLIKGDLLNVLPSLDSNSFDAIVVDPPYGIRADEYRTITKVAGERKHHEGHFYDDTPEYSDQICSTVLREGFRLLRSRGIIFMFCDPDRFAYYREAALKQAFSVWRTPLIWHKTGAASGFAPWGAGGFIRSYEMILFATKGRKILTSPGGPDVLQVDRVHHSNRQHAAEKPVELLLKLIKLACIPGDHVLDPCCGSGSIFAAANEAHMVATGIEIDPAYHATAGARILKAAEAPAPEAGT